MCLEEGNFLVTITMEHLLKTPTEMLCKYRERGINNTIDTVDTLINDLIEVSTPPEVSFTLHLFEN